MTGNDHGACERDQQEQRIERTRGRRGEERRERERERGREGTEMQL